MSWTVSINLGDSFVEVSAFKLSDKLSENGGSQKILAPEAETFRRFLPRVPLKKALQEFKDTYQIDEVERVLCSTKLAQKILRQRLGATPALLVTRGFENWLEMNLPHQHTFFTTKPNRKTSPLNPSIVFGVNERTNAQGSIDTQIDINELEFLSAKLKMNESTHVAIGFLHSNLNNTNEQQVAHFLKEQGFQVFASSENKNSTNDPNGKNLKERTRWWHGVLNAYAEPIFKESFLAYCEDIREVFGASVKTNILGQEGDFSEQNHQSVLETMFGATEQLTHHFKTHSRAPKNVLYFGLEEFFLLNLSQTGSNQWNGEFGPVAISHSHAERLRIQPTQILSTGYWGCPSFSPDEQGYEPGPICMGKGFNPTFLDLLFLSGNLPDIPGLTEQIKPNCQSRIQDELYACSKEAHKRDQLRPSEIPEWLLKNALTSLGSELHALAYKKEILCCGPLAPTLFPLLNRLNLSVQLKSHPLYNTAKVFLPPPLTNETDRT